jgi:hypothetical protein
MAFCVNHADSQGRQLVSKIAGRNHRVPGPQNGSGNKASQKDLIELQ